MLSPLEQVSANLYSIGARSIDEFLSLDPVQLAKVPYDLRLPNAPKVSNPLPPPSSNANLNLKDSGPPPPIEQTQSVVRLHHACQRAFGGRPHLINFEYIEEKADEKQCILTITHPDGAVRSYKTEPVFLRRNEAKERAATIAIEHGALDFITHGDSEMSRAIKGTLLAPLENNQHGASTSSSVAVGDSLSRVQQIEACCREWRVEEIRPTWFNFEGSDSNAASSNICGAALKIQLTPHCYRVYSCEPTYENHFAAQESCANVAIKEGVLDFIRHGNGQTAPRAQPAVHSHHPTRRSAPWSLQSFYESIPRPIEEDFGDKAAVQINAVGYLRKALENAKGARFIPSFHSLSVPSDALPSRIAHGCLLQIRRPGLEDILSYLVEPQCPSSKEARAAVALLALCLGVAARARKVSEAVESLISPEIRKFVQSYVFGPLANETRRINGIAPAFEYSSANNVFGCTLLVYLKPGQTDPRSWSVPPQYGSKPDARIAVAYLAAREGVLDLLEHGGAPPPGYEPAFEFDAAGNPVEPMSKLKRQKRKRELERQAQALVPQAKKQKQKQKLKQNTAAEPHPLSGGVLLGDGSRVSIAGPSRHGSGSRRRRSESLEDGEVPED